MNHNQKTPFSPASKVGLLRVLLKVCGVTIPNQAKELRELGVDLLGLNFHPSSPRFVSAELARQLVQAWGDQSTVVGVFVDRSAQEVIETHQATGFGIAQLHGDETAETVAEVASKLPVIKAFRIKDHDSLERAGHLLDLLKAKGVELKAVLIDGYSASAHGGTGVSVAKDLVISATRLHPNLILAGGLTPGNLAERLAWVQPWAVDVASGVESSPGVKQMDAVLSIVQMIRKTAR